MAKFYTIIAIFLMVVVALVAAEPRYWQAKRLAALRAPARQNQPRFFARQEVAPGTAAPAAAPYPAAGVTPEIPFDLPTETEKPTYEPDQTYGPPEPTPDETYGPPEATPDETYGPPEATPDETYGPPEATPDQNYGPPEDTTTTDGADDDNQQPAIEEHAEEIQPSSSEADLVSQNLIQPRRKIVRSRSRSAPLRVRAVSARSIRPSPTIVEIIRSEPILVYTLN